VGAALVTIWIAIAAPADPLKLFLWALNFSASAVFPVLVLSVWWKRINAQGAIAGMLGGLSAAAVAVLLGETEAWDLPGTLAGAVGLPVGAAAAVAVSVLTRVPARSVIDGVNEMRIPGGETLYDREVRLLRLKTPATT
jgi:cation/acetate symporter